MSQLRHVGSMIEPILLAPDFGAPLPIVVAIAILVVGLLVLRFIVKTVITLVKIAILVAIGVATYVGLSYVVGAIA